MVLKEIKEMIQLMHEHQLVELEVEREGVKIRLRKNGDTVTQSVIAAPAPVAAPAAPAAAPVADRAPVKSPMVGTFYRAPAPDAPPFVESGQTIEVGQVICIIEAMKLMNEIKAEVRGRVVEMPVQNGDPVEFGQPLFIIEPL